MTDQDNLRNRIAKALFDESYLDAPPETIPNEIHPGYHEMAQAIIDELRTDEAIERVARGILYSEFPGDVENCDYHWKFFSDHYLKQARTAITALLGEEPCHR